MNERIPCPNCPPYKSASLSVNRALGIFHCFRCGISGKNKKLVRPTSFKAQVNGLDWPEEYVPLRPDSVKSLCQRAALRYLKNRGLTDEQILLFRIGYCASGAYQGRVIVPVFQGNEIVYFVARSISQAEERRYLNPPMPKTGVTFKTFLGKAHDAVIVEGVFDAISVSRYLPAIALLSKNPTEEQVREVSKAARNLIVMLDSDALSTALSVSQRLSYYAPVRTIRLAKGDPGDLSQKELYEVLNARCV